jgi:hypothetical protein
MAGITLRHGFYVLTRMAAHLHWAGRMPNDNSKDFQRIRHARYFENNVLYHVVFRTIQGFFLLNPDSGRRLRRVVAGILSRARKAFAGVRNHGTSILSNHGHLALSGNHQQLAAYVGFVKRELSRRWGPVVGWRGIFEDGYQATAIITPEAQRRCLKYIMAQSAKENITSRPEEWPGFHCAASLVSGEPIDGEWFNGTRYGKELHRAKRTKDAPIVRKEDYIEACSFTFDPLTSLAHLSPEDYRGEMKMLVEEVVAEAKEQWGGKPPLGVEAVLATDPMTRSEIPPPPWFEQRRRLIVWDAQLHPDVIAYRERYWEFQERFRSAAEKWKQGTLTAVFPPGAFRPGLARPVAHPLQNIAA